MVLFKTIFHLEKSFRPKHLRVITISQFDDPSISPCCQFLMRRTEREHAQRVGKGDTVVIIVTLTLSSSTTWDKSEDCIGSGAPRDNSNTFPPRRASAIVRSPPSLLHAKGAWPARPLNSFFRLFVFVLSACVVSMMASNSLTFLSFFLGTSIPVWKNIIGTYNVTE